MMERLPRIKKLRMEHSLTQNEIADVIGITQTGYLRYETGKNNLPITVLFKLCDAFNISSDYILELSDDKEILWEECFEEEEKEVNAEEQEQKSEAEVLVVQ